MKRLIYISLDSSACFSIYSVNQVSNPIFTFARVDLLEKRSPIVDSLNVRYRDCASARRIHFLLGAAFDNILTMKTSVRANRMSAIKLVNNEPLAKVRISRIALWRHVGLQSRGSGNFNTSPCSSFFNLQLPSPSHTRFYRSPTLVISLSPSSVNRPSPRM